MGIRQPTATGALFKQAGALTQQSDDARKKLKQPATLGSSASTSTQMVAATTGAQQQATQQVQEKQTSLTKDISGDKITTPTATASSYTGPTPTVIADTSNVKSVADTIKDIGTKKVQMNLGAGMAEFEIPAVNYSANIETLTANQTALQNNLNTIDDAIKKHDAGILPLAEQDLKALQDAKDQMMKSWQEYSDAIEKQNLGQIAGPSTFETEMFKRENVLAEQGNEVGKLASLFGGETGRVGALSAQAYAKELENLRKGAREGLRAKTEAERQAVVAEQEYTGELDRTKKSVEEKVKSEQNKIDTLKSDWQELKNKGENLTSLSKIFGSEDEAKKYYNFDENGNLISDKRSVTRDALVKQRDVVSGELGKTQEKLKDQETKNFGVLSNQLITKDKYGNITGGLLTDIKNNISSFNDKYKYNFINTVSYGERKAIVDKYITNLATVENEINNAIASNDPKRLKEAKDKLSTWQNDYRNELNQIAKPAPVRKDTSGKERLDPSNMITGQTYRGPDGKLYGKPIQTMFNPFPVVMELDENGKVIREARNV